MRMERKVGQEEKGRWKRLQPEYKIWKREKGKEGTSGERKPIV